MKRRFMYAIILIALLLTTCATNRKAAQDTGINRANLDTTVAPGNNFDQYANGAWKAANPLKPEYASYGAFNALAEKTEQQLQDLIIELSRKSNKNGSIAQKIGDLYALGMDTKRLKSEGAAPALPYLQKIQSIDSKAELSKLLGEIYRDGAYPFFGANIGPDDMDSSINILHLYQGGIRMGDRDYYLHDDERSQNLRVKYVEMIETIFTLAGYQADEVKKASAAVMNIETRLAQAAFSNEQLRDPYANYHKITIEQLAETAPAINWHTYFSAFGMSSSVTELNLMQREPMAEVSAIIDTVALDDIKRYLSWSFLRSVSAFLSEDFYDAIFAYHATAVLGIEQKDEHWKRVVSILDMYIGEGIGQLYVEKHFPPAAKEKMMGLVRNLQVALGERIRNLDWMSDETKTAALAKLGTFRVKIGYPDKWRVYDDLTINKEASYLDNIIRCEYFYVDDKIKDFNQPVDKDKWFITPQTVNAFYNPSENSINFPAAILQPPFFNMEADDAVNYGAIGAIIGHEMTHGFDDNGRSFDKDGNLNDWWTEEDAAQFNARAQVLVDYFDALVVLGDTHANGRLTLGENIADLGGLQVAWQAYLFSQKGKEAPLISGFTGGQRFFLAFATCFAENIRDETMLYYTQVEPHSLGTWRINGTLPQIDAWYEAFGVTPDQALYIPKERRASIW